MKVDIYTDGASRGNPGQAGIGVVIKEKDKVILEIGEHIGKTTNNVAEYLALIKGLIEAVKLKAHEISVFADSELLVKQVKGEYKVKHEGIIPLYYLAKTLISNFKSFHIRHIPREQNRQADDLANQGLDRELIKLPAG